MSVAREMYGNVPFSVTNPLCASHIGTVREIAEVVPEVVAFYWTVLAPDIVNPGREEQGSVSV